MEFWPLKTLSEVSWVLSGLQLSPTPNMGVHLGVWGNEPSHSLDSLHSREHVMWLPGLLLGPQPPCLGRKPNARVATLSPTRRRGQCPHWHLEFSSHSIALPGLLLGPHLATPLPWSQAKARVATYLVRHTKSTWELSMGKPTHGTYPRAIRKLVPKGTWTLLRPKCVEQIDLSPRQRRMP
jgi:hypothetical protein